jgi:hypothetical protein
MVSLLIDKGAEVNWMNWVLTIHLASVIFQNLDTSLIVATHSGNFQIVSLLIDRGADVNRMNKVIIMPLLPRFCLIGWSDCSQDRLLNLPH